MRIAQMARPILLSAVLLLSLSAYPRAGSQNKSVPGPGGPETGGPQSHDSDSSVAVASADADQEVKLTKIKGTIQCAKPDQQSAIPVGDHAGHAFVVMKAKCTWAKPLELVGTTTKTGQDTVFSEVDGAKSRDSGYDVTSMTNGDQFVVRFTGTTRVDKNGIVQSQTGTWTFLSGTGKLKRIIGKGTYSGKGAADGTVTTDVEGEYLLAPLPVPG